MRNLLVVALGASVLALPQAAAAQPPAAAPAPTASQPPAPLAHAGSSGAEQICKTYTPAGTRFSKKECHTRAEWDQMAADARNTLNDSTHPNPGGPH